MAQKGKVDFRPVENNFTRNITIDRSDIKFIEVALRTYDKIIVSEDSDFLNNNTKRELSRAYGITVYTIEEALKNLKK